MSNQKVCIVTGGNKGIGYAIVKILCQKFDGFVYLTSRNEQRGKEAVESLKKLGLSPIFHQLDIEDSESIAKAVVHIKEAHGGVDILVNNAAFAFKKAATEPFSHQAEVTIRINYFGTARVLNEFLPILRPHARVVNVSSSAGHLACIGSQDLRDKLSANDLTVENLDHLMNEFVRSAKKGTWKEDGWPARAYAVSKVGVSALTRIHQRILNKDDREDLVVNSCHPGCVSTDMSSHTGPLTIEQGAVCPVHLALLPKNTEMKGKYFWHDTSEVDWLGPCPENI